MLKILIISFILLISTQTILSLYPFETETRSRISLNGLWNFKVDFKNQGLNQSWHQKEFKTQVVKNVNHFKIQTNKNINIIKLEDTIKIAVPSSYNELFTNYTIRNHVGWVWYNRDFHINTAVKKTIKDHSVILRISSCHYYCMVWLNGDLLGYHESGHLPFEFDITQNIIGNVNNLFNLVIAVNNTLDMNTIPPAGLFYGNDPNLYPKNYVEQNLQMDFFNYAGLHRDVLLYTKPLFNIQDINIKTDYLSDSNQGILFLSPNNIIT